MHDRSTGKLYNYPLSAEDYGRQDDHEYRPQNNLEGDSCNSVT
jgi:hypothetical protein